MHLWGMSLAATLWMFSWVLACGNLRLWSRENIDVLGFVQRWTCGFHEISMPQICFQALDDWSNLLGRWCQWWVEARGFKSAFSIYSMATLTNMSRSPWTLWWKLLSECNGPGEDLETTTPPETHPASAKCDAIYEWCIFKHHLKRH